MLASMGWQGRGLGAKGEGIVAPVSGGRRSPYHPRAAPIPNPDPYPSPSPYPYPCPYPYRYPYPYPYRYPYP